MQTIRSVSIIRKKGLEEASFLAGKVQNWLEARAITVSTPDHRLSNIDLMQSLEKNDLVLVLGGDGTMIRVARGLATLALQNSAAQMPAIGGINLGGVGFLAELDSENWQCGLKKSLEAGLKAEKRMALHITVMRPENEIAKNGAAEENTFAQIPQLNGYTEAGYKTIVSGVAVNDVVLSRGGLARLLAIDLFVDNEHLTYLRADGVIVSSPTGSTGYTGSAGGPLLSPALNAYAVTAICPFLSQSMPLVITGYSVLTLSMRSACANSFITLDGQEFIKLHTNDRIYVKGIPKGINFANFGTASYYSKLRSSGIVRDSSGGPASDKMVCEDC